MRRAILTAGLGFGDEGKGRVVDALVRATGATLVVRYSGGAQCAHHVEHRGRVHRFSQLGSGSFEGAATYLGPEVLTDPLALAREAQVFDGLVGGNVLDRVTVHPDAPVITPYHRAANQLAELARGGQPHGSTGIGIGELRADLLNPDAEVIRWRDLLDRDAHDLAAMAGAVRMDRLFHLAHAGSMAGTLGEDKERAFDLLLRPSLTWAVAAQQVARSVAILPDLPACEVAVFEGAQGVLIDETHGFAPHTTWSDVTFTHADALLNAAFYDGERVRVGVTRAYLTRHGAGPLPTESSSPDPLWLRGEHNDEGRWQGPMRYGIWDAVLGRYAVRCLGRVDWLAVTCLDRVREPFTYCPAYELEDETQVSELPEWKLAAYVLPHVTHDEQDAATVIGRELKVPVGLASWGTTDDKVTVAEALRTGASVTC